MDPKPGIFFYDTNGERLGSDVNLWPIPLYEDMEITIHPHEGVFKVKGWTYHHGHPDEEWGLTIILRRPVTPRVGSIS